MRLIEAIAAYERQREACEGWAAFLRAVERVKPEFYTALVKRLCDTFLLNKKTIPMKKYTCCQLACASAAEWLIVDGPAPDDYTHSCSAHVGELLSEAPEQRIYPLDGNVA